MNEMKIVEKTERRSTNASIYVPSLELTKGQPEPIAANGGLSYYSFDEGGDAGTGVDLESFRRLVDDTSDSGAYCQTEGLPWW